LIKGHPAGTLVAMSIEKGEAMSTLLSAVVAHERIRDLRRVADRARVVRSARPKRRQDNEG
jgi:hypothetical protein